jgi:hypothetical protein
MDLQILTQFFMWCTIINVVLVIGTALIWLFGADFVYKMHGRFFPMPRETFNAIFYTFIGIYKLLVYVFSLVPWIALLIIT